ARAPHAGRLHQRTAAAASDKGDDLAHNWIAFEFLSRRLKPVGKACLPEEELSIGPAQAMHVGPGISSPLETKDVETGKIGKLADGISEWNQVGSHTAHSADHGALADSNELMHRGISAKETEIIHSNMATQHGVVGK